jgi:hypothetical protein
MIPEWQARVHDEHKQLTEKLEKLNKHLDLPVEVISGSPAETHRQLLRRQAREMEAYASTLAERIALFPQLS